MSLNKFPKSYEALWLMLLGLLMKMTCLLGSTT